LLKIDFFEHFLLSGYYYYYYFVYCENIIIINTHRVDLFIFKIMDKCYVKVILLSIRNQKCI